MSASTVITRSDKRPAVTAEITPTRMPKPSQMMPAPIVRDSVAGMPLLISWTTFSWLEYDFRLPLKSDCIIAQYCE